MEPNRIAPTHPHSLSVIPEEPTDRQPGTIPHHQRIDDINRIFDGAIACATAKGNIQRPSAHRSASIIDPEAPWRRITLECYHQREMTRQLLDSRTRELRVYQAFNSHG